MELYSVMTALLVAAVVVVAAAAAVVGSSSFVGTNMQPVKLD